MATQPSLSDLSAEQLRARAREYREMAKTATSEATGAGLTRLAEQFEALAQSRELLRATG